MIQMGSGNLAERNCVGVHDMMRATGTAQVGSRQQKQARPDGHRYDVVQGGVRDSHRHVARRQALLDQLGLQQHCPSLHDNMSHHQQRRLFVVLEQKQLAARSQHPPNTCETQKVHCNALYF